MSKAIEAYQQNESTYRPGISKLLLDLESALKVEQAANGALRSSNAMLIKANQKINAAHVLLKERICALGCLLLALGIGFVVLLPL